MFRTSVGVNFSPTFASKAREYFWLGTHG